MNERKILIVDDDEDILLIVQTLLTNAGYAPILARIAASTIGGVSASASFPKTGNVPKQTWTARRAAIARPSTRGCDRGSGNGRC